MKESEYNWWPLFGKTLCLPFLHYSSFMHRHCTSILKFQFISHIISTLVGNSINFFLSSHRQLGSLTTTYLLSKSQHNVERIQELTGKCINKHIPSAISTFFMQPDGTLWHACLVNSSSAEKILPHLASNGNCYLDLYTVPIIHNPYTVYRTLMYKTHIFIQWNYLKL